MLFRSRVILATNVAETSLTIPGIVYVIDTGVARLSRYESRTGTTTLHIEAISQASADQRKGRCGRVRDGICVRLFDEESFAAAEELVRGKSAPLHPSAITLLHSGIVYPSERDPTCLFAALERLVSAGKFGQGRLKVRFRAPGNDAMLNELARRHGLQAVVEASMRAGLSL